MVWCGFQNGHQKDICVKDIGPHAQDIMIIIDLIININEGAWMIHGMGYLKLQVG